MDKGSYFIKIVEWNLKGQGVCFIFRTAERTFPTAECTFPTAVYTFRTAEHKTNMCSYNIQTLILMK